MRFRIIKNGVGQYRIQRKRWYGWRTVNETWATWQNAVDRITALQEAPEWRRKRGTWTIMEYFPEEKS